MGIRPGVIVRLLSRLWFRLKFLMLGFALLLFGLLLPGLWLAGVPLGIGLSALLLRHVLSQNELPKLPPTRGYALACYALSALPAFGALLVAAQISKVVRDGPDYEVTILGVALGFFLHPAYKLIRLGRHLKLQAQPFGATIEGPS